MAMIAITTNNSISVNPDRPRDGRDIDDLQERLERNVILLR
jgi:hypothetical protein